MFFSAEDTESDIENWSAAHSPRVEPYKKEGSNPAAATMPPSVARPHSRIGSYQLLDSPPDVLQELSLSGFIIITTIVINLLLMVL
jgi:hypothetical protein